MSIARGLLFSFRGGTERALADYSSAIKLDPKSAETYLARAGLYAQVGQHDSAIADLNNVIKLVPNAAGPYYNTTTAATPISPRASTT